MLIAKGAWAFPADCLVVYWVEFQWWSADFTQVLYYPSSGLWTCFCSEKHVSRTDEKEGHLFCSEVSIIEIVLCCPGEKCSLWLYTGSSSSNAWYLWAGLHHSPDSHYWELQQSPLTVSHSSPVVCVNVAWWVMIGHGLSNVNAGKSGAPEMKVLKAI